jgi:PAS domain-containing protein
MAEAQKPLELILARNLLSSISPPGFLVDERGTLVFSNEAAGALVGRRFEETGALGPREWGEAFGPFDAKGRRIPWDQLPLNRAPARTTDAREHAHPRRQRRPARDRGQRPAHRRHRGLPGRHRDLLAEEGAAE